MNEAAITIAEGADGTDAEGQDRDIRAEWVAGQVADLARLRQLSMEMAERMAALQMRICAEVDLARTPEEARALAKEAVEQSAVLALAMNRMDRSVRQLVALEQEASGLRDPKSMQGWKRRNAETARTLRTAVRDGVKKRLPGTDKETLNSLLGDLFRDYDDYDDYAQGEIGPLVDRVTERLSQGSWGSKTLEEIQRDDEELERLIAEELDRIAKFQNEHGRLPNETDADCMADEPARRQNGHDPP